jgi:hypothetical protein
MAPFTVMQGVAVGAGLGVASVLALRKLAKYAQEYAIKWLQQFTEQLIQAISTKFADQLKEASIKLDKCEEHLGQVAVTSQVCATLANITEWRSCLQSIADWHGVSLQSAYNIWQAAGSKVPSCPANQSMEVAGSQPMTLTDQVWSSVSMDSARPVPRFQQDPEVDRLESYIWSIEANLAAVGACSWQVTRWPASKLVSLESMKPWINEVEQYFREVLQNADPDGGQFLCPAQCRQVAEFCMRKCDDLEGWASREAGIAQAWDPVY